MPEFEEIKPNPNLQKEDNQYQPSKGKTAQDTTSSTPSSNMRGRWKPSSRGPAPKPVAKDEPQSCPNLTKESFQPEEREEVSYSPENYDLDEHDEYEHEQDYDNIYQKEPVQEKEERNPRSHSQKKPREEKPFKVTSRKDVFIPKTKQDSERYRNRTSSSKKTSLWHKILAFFGLGTKSKKHSSEHRSHSKYSDSRGQGRSSSHNRRPYQQKRQSGPQRHRSGPPHKQDKKSND